MGDVARGALLVWMRLEQWFRARVMLSHDCMWAVASRLSSSRKQLNNINISSRVGSEIKVYFTHLFKCNCKSKICFANVLTPKSLILTPTQTTEALPSDFGDDS